MAAYNHKPQALTAGQIRAALAEVPDDTPVQVSTLRHPSSHPTQPLMEDCRFVVTSAGLEPDWVPPGGGRKGYWVEPGSTVVLECDFPPGEYET